MSKHLLSLVPALILAQLLLSSLVSVAQITAPSHQSAQQLTEAISERMD